MVPRMSVQVGPEKKPPEDEASGSNPLGRTFNENPHRTHGAGLLSDSWAIYCHSGGSVCRSRSCAGLWTF
jgi:hypothetical protein